VRGSNRAAGREQKPFRRSHSAAGAGVIQQRAIIPSHCNPSIGVKGGKSRKLAWRRREGLAHFFGRDKAWA